MGVEGRYHLLNNEAPSDVQQVHELLERWSRLWKKNGGGVYTNAMYLEVIETAIGRRGTSKEGGVGTG
ncbi:unnamed protein product [Arctogadus glacialis]